MRTRIISAVAVATLLFVPAAFASFGGSGGSAPSTPPQSPDPPPSGDATLTPRQQAERLYGDAYDDVAKAKQDVTGGKAKNAEKRFRRALDHAKQAAQLDTTYVEAWNLIGFASRKLGDYPASLAAYQHCLALQPDYAPAREYLGEAYVELGQPRLAREQLVWLEKLQQVDQAKMLRDRIEAYEVAHPDSAVAPVKRDSTNLTTGRGAGQ